MLIEWYIKPLCYTSCSIFIVTHHILISWYMCWSLVSALCNTCTTWGLARKVFASLSFRILCCKMSAIMTWVVSRALSNSLISFPLVLLSCWLLLGGQLLDRAAVRTCILWRTNPLSLSSMSTKRYRHWSLFWNTICDAASSSRREPSECVELVEVGDWRGRGLNGCWYSVEEWKVVSIACIRSVLEDSNPLRTGSAWCWRRQTRIRSFNRCWPTSVA